MSLLIDMVQQQEGLAPWNCLQTKPSKLCLEYRCMHGLVVREESHWDLGGGDGGGGAGEKGMGSLILLLTGVG